jgi:hypothetical protein
MKKMVVLLAAVMVAGCVSTPKTALNAKTLRANRVIYFEQSDRVPKDVLIAAKPAGEVGISAAAIDKIIEEVISIAPKLAKIRADESIENVLIGRRMLFVGYDTPEQLAILNDIVASMSQSIERLK